MQLSGKSRSYGSMGWIIIAVIVAIFAFASRQTLFGGSAAQSPLGGEWVGIVDITGGYDDWLGSSPGKHDKAAIRFTLETYDGIVHKYNGSGEMHIEGEAQPREIRIVDIFLDLEDHPEVSGTMVGNWGPDDQGENRHAHDFKAILHGDDLMLIEEDPLGLRFKGMMHRGNDTKYRQLYKGISSIPDRNVSLTANAS